MTTKETGGPAFPYPWPNNTPSTGMTLRDYFAAKAMAIAWDAYDKGYCGIDNDDFDSASLAKHAYQIADAMIEARKK